MELVRIFMDPECNRAKMKCARCGGWGDRWLQVENFVIGGGFGTVEVVNCGRHGVGRPAHNVGLAKDLQK